MVCTGDTKKTNTYMNNYKSMITKTIKVYTAGTTKTQNNQRGDN